MVLRSSRSLPCLKVLTLLMRAPQNPFCLPTMGLQFHCESWKNTRDLTYLFPPSTLHTVIMSLVSHPPIHLLSPLSNLFCSNIAALLAVSRTDQECSLWSCTGCSLSPKYCSPGWNILVTSPTLDSSLCPESLQGGLPRPCPVCTTT